MTVGAGRRGAALGNRVQGRQRLLHFTDFFPFLHFTDLFNISQIFLFFIFRRFSLFYMSQIFVFNVSFEFQYYIGF